MNLIKYTFLITSFLFFLIKISFACEVKARVSVVGNEFPAIQTLGAGVKKCKGAEVKTNLTADHQKINVAGMSSEPAEYTSAIVANTSIVALLNNDLIRPLDDLVKKHGSKLKKNQLITINGKVMAVAFMANAQHLVYRKDILEKLNISVPKTYEEMLSAAKKIRTSGLAKNPVGGAYKAGWNLAQEFNNMFIGYGGKHFKGNTPEPNVNTDAGKKALNMMKSLSEYMNPDFLTHDSNATNAEFRAGNVILMNMWGSRAATLTDADGVSDAVKKGMDIAGPMTVGGGNIPASTLFWDGWTVAKKISDAEAEATFIAMMNAIDPSIIKDDKVRKQAVWLLDGYTPTDAARGVFAAAKMNTTPYPMLPYAGLMHSAIGAEIADFMQGKENAKKTLSDIEDAYRAAAKEKGFL
jgi:trehalose/maltose transport system substrate-binding protein